MYSGGMKKRCAYPAVLLLLILIASATAQTPPNPGLYPQPLAQVKEFLQLTDAQVFAGR